ncbi:MAG: glycerophosphodiester phosphodiesterase family protein [Proteobacteria bacterium]|nr:glycerophosphodiester phosphodiesterase family protein [Pseudomonadota bacterium]MDA1022729.1 glycerophosphodiester phosphodiesterase family protein [Pseudomonadota bacterium]
MTETPHPVLPKVIGHRGAAGHAPENTLASLEKAAALGVRWVEFDVQLSADRVVVLFHDERLERTTDGKGAVADWTWGDLQGLDAGGWFGAVFAGERAPSLEQAVAALTRLGLGAVVEIKPCAGWEAETAEVAAGVLKEIWPAALPPPLVSSFKEECLEVVRRVAPEYALALNVFKLPRGWKQKARSLGLAAIHCRENKLTQKQVGAMIAEGVTVRAFCIDDTARAEELYGWGVEGVFSDFPDRLLVVSP